MAMIPPQYKPPCLIGIVARCIAVFPIPFGQREVEDILAVVAIEVKCTGPSRRMSSRYKSGLGSSSRPVASVGRGR